MTEENSLWRKIVHSHWGTYMDRKEISKILANMEEDCEGKY